MTTINLHRLSIVLKHANSSPPSWCREEFYALKQAILERYGIWAGEDIQHIRKECWSCTNGTYCDGEVCRRCDGRGVYSERWILLERWLLAGQMFHRPLRSLVGSLRPVTIEGIIRKRFKRLCEACWRVLSMLFRPSYFLYLDQFRMDEKALRRFKAVLAYLLEFPRTKWQVQAVKFSEMQEAAEQMKLNKMIPF